MPSYGYSMLSYTTYMCYYFLYMFAYAQSIPYMDSQYVNLGIQYERMEATY
jgi:hypothetical protein